MRVRIIIERRRPGAGPGSTARTDRDGSSAAGHGFADSALLEALAQLGYQASLEERLPASGVDPAEVLLIDARRLRQDMLATLAALAAARRMPKIIALTRKGERTFRMDTLMRAGVSTVVPWDPADPEPTDGSLKTLLDYALREVLREDRGAKRSRATDETGRREGVESGGIGEGRGRGSGSSSGSGSGSGDEGDRRDAATAANERRTRAASGIHPKRVRRVIWWKTPFTDPRRRRGPEPGPGSGSDAASGPGIGPAGGSGIGPDGGAPPAG